MFIEFRGGQFAGRMGSFMFAGMLRAGWEQQIKNHVFLQGFELFADGQFAGKIQHDIIAGRLRAVCK